MTAPKSPKQPKRPQNSPISETEIQARAFELWRSRTTSEKDVVEQYLNEAKQQLELELELAAKLKGWRRVASWLNQPFLYLEKRVWEPGADLVERAAFFQIIEKISPVFEAIGVLLIPFVVWWATQSYQMQKDEQDRAVRQQEAIKTYLNQLTTVFLDGKIKEDKDLQTVTRASTLALLKDPALDGEGKGQVIGFLSELNLIAIEAERETDEKASKLPIMSLANADLRYANLSFVNLRYANLSSIDLRYANLSSANLSSADLSKADLLFAKLRLANLSFANLSGANLTIASLTYADLSDADLSDAYLDLADLRYAKLSFAKLSDAKLRLAKLGNADLSKADLSKADLSYADFSFADLSKANLSKADLSYAYLQNAKNWTDEQLQPAELCKTTLPKGSKLNPDRDCK